MATGTYNIIKKVTFLLAVTLLCSFKAQAQVEVEYGFTQNPADPLLITANAYPNVSSNDVTVSTATFTFLVPAGTILQPTGLTTGAPGMLIDRNGVWRADTISAAAWGNSPVGNASDLEGYDLYQMTLSPGSIVVPAPTGDQFVAGEPFPLFEFRLPFDCAEQDVRILVNDEPIRNILFNLASFNTNNQFSVSVDNEASTDKYAINRANAHTLECSLVDLTMTKTDTQINDGGDGVVDAGVDTIEYEIVVTNTGSGSTGNIVVTDPLPGTTVVCGNDGTDDNIITPVLAPNASETCTATHIISQDEVNALSVTNQAVASVPNPDTSVNPDPFIITELSDDPDEPADVENENPSDGGVATGASASTEPDDPTVVALPAAAGIEITKSVMTPANTVGGEVTFGFVVTNTGNVPLTGVDIDDTLVDYDGNTRALSGPAVFVNSTALSPEGTLDVGEAANYTGTYILTQDDIDAGGLENNAQVTAMTPGGVEVTDDSDTTTDPSGAPIPPATDAPECNAAAIAPADNDPTCLNIAADPSLEVVKSVTTGGSDLGDVIEFEIVVTNNGNVTLSDISIADTLVGANGAAITGLVGPTFSSATAGASVASLPVDGALTYVASVSISQAILDAGGIENSATATGTPPEAPDGTQPPDVQDVSDAGTDMAGNPVPASPELVETPGFSPADGDLTNDPTPYAIAAAASILAEKTIVTPGSAVGDTVEFEIYVTNNGGVTLSNIMVADTLVDNLGAALTIAAPVFDSANAMTTAGATEATLPVGSTLAYTASYTIQQSDVDAGGIENNAVATGTPPSGPAVEDDSDTQIDPNGATITNPPGGDTPECDGTTDGSSGDDPTCMNITPAPSLLVEKTIITSGSAVGDTVEFEIYVTNNGNVTLTAISVADTLIDNTGAPLTIAAPVFDSANAMTTAGATEATLPVDSTLAYTASYTIQQSDIDAGGIENNAVATGTPPSGPDVMGDSDTLVDPDGNPVTDPPNEDTPECDGTTDGSTSGDPTCMAIAATPSLSVEKTIVTPGAVAGDVVEFEIYVTNDGNVTLTDVEVDDTLIDNNGVALTVAAPAFDFNHPMTTTTPTSTPSSLPVGSTLAYTVSYTLTQSDIDAGGIENNAVGTGTPPLAPDGTQPPDVMDDSDTQVDPDGNPVTDPPNEDTSECDGTTDGSNSGDPTCMVIAPAPSIAVNKTAIIGGTGAGALGDPVNFTITVLNDGNVTLSGVSVTDTMMDYAGAPLTLTTGPDFAGPSSMGSAEGDLLVGEVATYTATYVLDAATIFAGGIENQAVGTATDPNGTVVMDDSDSGNPAVAEPNCDGTPADADPGNDPTCIEIERAEIIGQVWEDINGNGVQDVDEPRLPGILVRLINDANMPVASSITDSFGDYTFTDVPPATYTLEFVTPVGYAVTQQEAGPSPLIDSNPDPVTNITDPVSLTPGVREETVDAGLYVASSISGRVWNDLDGDGLQDANEDPLPNVTVTLTDSAGNETTITTGVNGNYIFDSLPPETYTVTVDSDSLNPNLVQTYDDDGPLDNTSGPIVIESGDTHQDSSFGYKFNTTPEGSVIASTIWLDSNTDGVIDPGEARLGGVPVVLYDKNRMLVATTTTDDNGFYTFLDVPPGTDYKVVVNPDEDGRGQPPAGLIAHELGDPDVKDRETETPNSETVIPELLPNSSFQDADFGFSQVGTPITIGDSIFQDVNGNGVRDPDEGGIANVSVSLFDSETGNLLSTTVTDADGKFGFVGVEENKTYDLVVQDTNGVLTGMEQTSMPGEVDGGVPGDSSNKSTVVVTTESNVFQDFGYSQPGGAGTGIIGDLVFLDTSGDGAYTAGEGMSQVSVTLYNVTDGGYKIGLEQTDENGNYIFTGLELDKEYRVEVEESTLPNAGVGLSLIVSPTATPIGVALANATNTLMLTAASPVRLDQDFGYASTDNGEITGTLWVDTNGDGVLTADETERFSETTVELLDETRAVISVTSTDEAGNYSFDNLPFAPYFIKVTDITNQTEGYLHTDGTFGLNNHSQNDQGYIVVLSAAAPSNDTADFGYEPDVTTPITLASFNSVNGSANGEVEFKWSTGTEIGNIGFRIFAEIEGNWISVAQDLIPAVGDSMSLIEYSYSASGLENASQFVLVDVDLFGKQVLHGPFALGEFYGAERNSSVTSNQRSLRSALETKAQKSAPDLDARSLREEREKEEFKKMLDNMLNRPQAFNTPENSVSSANNTLLAAGVWVLNAVIGSAHASSELHVANLGVNVEGVYQVSASQLASSGINIAGVASSSLMLKENGKDIAIEVIDGGDGVFDIADKFRFLGRGVDTLYTGTNNYRLSLGDGGARISENNVSLRRGPSAPYYMDTVEYSPERLYSLTSPSGDPWFAHKIASRDNAAYKEVPLMLDGLVKNSIAPELTVNLWGASEHPGEESDHHILISVNGTTFHDAKFDGVQSYSHTTPVNTSQPEFNIGISVPGDLGYPFDVVNLDSIQVSYPRGFAAKNSALTFTSAWPKFNVTGFDSTSISAYAQSDEGSVAKITGLISGGSCSPSNPSCETLIPGVQGDATYFVVANSAIKKAQISIPSPAADINVNAHSLVIAHPDFIGRNLEQYVAQLRSEVGSAELIDVRNIYDQYNGGVFDARAIHTYIKSMYANGTRQVIFVGGDNVDYRGYGESASAESLIPSLYAQTDLTIRFSPVDPKYGDVNGDDVPDIVIARLPVQTNTQLNNLLTKRAAYLSRSYTGKAVFAADINNPLEPYSFTSDANETINKYFSGWQTTKAYIDTLDISGANNAFTNSINNGVSLAVYMGHSTKDTLSFHNLFDGEDAANLTNNGQPTVVTQWGCYTTYNVESLGISMGDRFLLEGTNGAVSVMGASTLTDVNAERIISQIFYAELTKGKTLGRALLDAKRRFAKKYPEQKDILLGITIMGFPNIIVN